MSQSASRSDLRFLLDENVEKRVGAFLRSRGFDVIDAPKSLANGRLAALSQSEKRVLVTNDWDFTDSELFPKVKVFSIVLLLIPQDKPEAFIKAFSMLLDKKSRAEDFKGNLITLKEDNFDSFPIPSWKVIKFK